MGILMKRRTVNAVRRLQRGTENLEPGPLPPEKRLIGPKERAGIYDPGRGTPSQERDFAEEGLMNELRKSVYGTVGVQINGQEMEVPLWNKEMTPAQAEDAARMRLEWGLHPFTPDAELEAKQNAAGQGPDDASNLPKPNGYQKGTSSVKNKTDSVPAMLTPREAILNRNAAELLGRDAIKRLNDHGNMLAKRGVDLASDPTPGPSTENLLGYQYGTSMVQGDDRSDLLTEADNTFYGGGTAPMPTPTPTPTTRGYAYGTEDVRRRRMNAASRIQGITFSRDALRGIPSAAGRNISANFPQGQVIQSTTSSSGGGYGYGGGTLPPDQNPAYQAALRNNPTVASRYAQTPDQPSLVGKYQSDYGPRAAVSTGVNSFRTYDPQGGYIARTGNVNNFLDRQIGSTVRNPAYQPASVAPAQQQSVATTPTSLTVNTPGFQPSGLEANPFAGAPIQLTLDQPQQPRRYSDLY